MVISPISGTILFVEQDQAIDHVLSNVLGMKEPIITNVKAWMEHHGISSMSNLLDFYWQDPDNLKHAEYWVGNTKDRLASWPLAGLGFICKYGEDFVASNRSLMTDDDWLNTTKEDYDNFKCELLRSPTRTTPQQVSSQTPGAYSSATSRPTTYSPSELLLTTLRKSVKLDATAFPKLQDNKHIEPFWRSFQAVAKYQGMNNILNPKFVPNATEPGAKELFDFQNQFMYSVVLTTFLTDTAKTFVREHSQDMDAQKVIAKLIQYMKDSPRTTMEINRLTKYITGIKLDASWRGTHEQFLLHFKEQFRLLDDLIDPIEPMCERMRRILLENAVVDIPYLRNITNTDEYQQVFSHNRKINYEQYFNLLLVAAQRYDNSSQGNPNKRRTIYTHTFGDHGFGDGFDSQEGTQYGGIDLPTDQLIQVHKASIEDAIPDVSQDIYSIFQAGRFDRSKHQQGTSFRPRQQVDGFVKLPKDLWTVISEEFKQQIYNYNKNLPNSTNHTSTRQAFMQESMPPDGTSPISDPPVTHEQTPDANTDDQPDDNPFLAMVTEQSQMTADDIRHILSVHKSKRSEKVQHPVTRTANNHITYTFAHKNTSSNYQLVDRGANGGLAGADMKILNKTGRKVNICGIDNHELTGLDIVTCASMFDTNHGRVIGIFHEYAYHGQGRSIHSPAQMEWFKADIDDKSKALGGKQRLLTLEGYIIPFEVSGGLVYMKPLGIPTDDDMDKYPHVFMTDPHEWDPSVIDYKYESRADWETLGHSPGDEYYDPHFNAYGETTERVIANLEYLLDDVPSLMSQ